MREKSPGLKKVEVQAKVEITEIGSSLDLNLDLSLLTPGRLDRVETLAVSCRIIMR